MVKILIKKLSPEVELPSYKSTGASGMDLMAFIKSSITIKPKSSFLVPTGLSMAFSEDYEVQIRPRSGLAAKNNISVLNTPGTIDSDYRGEIKVIVYNHGNEDFVVNNKDRIAQMILTPVIKMQLEETKELPQTVRGKDGLGSTGKWATHLIKKKSKDFQDK